MRDIGGDLYFGRVVHYMDDKGQTACARSFDLSMIGTESETDMPPGTPRCKTCERKAP